MTINLKKRTQFFKKIGPGIAREMSNALKKLTSENIKVEFSSVQTFQQNKVFIDVGEKCFGSYVNFASQKNDLKGVCVAIFPVSSTKNLIELLLKNHVGSLGMSSEMKLSAFKEAINILLMVYITGIANGLKVRVKTDIPKFVHFHNIELAKPQILRSYSKSDSLVSVGQIVVTDDKSIAWGGGDYYPYFVLKAALLLFIETS